MLRRLHHRQINMTKSNWTSCFELRRLELACWIAACVGCLMFAALSHDRNLESAPVVSMRIDLNRAAMEELKSLPGMSTARARAVLLAREKRGGFQTVESLAEVKGITKAYLRRIADLIEVK